MTDFAAIRAERRRSQERRRRERIVATLRMVAFVCGLLLAFGLAGTLDMCDRQANLASMLPDTTQG